MSPEWLRQERRNTPSREEVEALVALNLRIVAEQVEENKQQLKENTRLLLEIQYRIDDITEHFEQHKKESQVVIDNFKVSKRLRALGAGAFFMVIAVVAFFKDGLDVLKHWAE